VTRGGTGHHCGAAKRTVTRDDLEAQRDRARALPPGPERERELRRLRGRIRNLSCRSERVV